MKNIWPALVFMIDVSPNFFLRIFFAYMSGHVGVLSGNGLKKPVVLFPLNTPVLERPLLA